tara:strand:+ start:116 stop:469 length:354 start_codon:yes stop_codon:yes gene_type:complete
MKTNPLHPPRKFLVGRDNQIEISHCANVDLKPNEQVTFVTDSNKEYDVVRKSWGFYATPSVNSRLKNQGFKTALVKNSKSQWYIMLVDSGQIDEFHSYLEEEKNEIVEWLDEKPLNP